MASALARDALRSGWTAHTKQRGESEGESEYDAEI